MTAFKLDTEKGKKETVIPGPIKNLNLSNRLQRLCSSAELVKVPGMLKEVDQ